MVSRRMLCSATFGVPAIVRSRALLFGWHTSSSKPRWRRSTPPLRSPQIAETIADVSKATLRNVRVHRRSRSKNGHSTLDHLSVTPQEARHVWAWRAAINAGCGDARPTIPVAWRRYSTGWLTTPNGGILLSAARDQGVAPREARRRR